MIYDTSIPGGMQERKFDQYIKASGEFHSTWLPCNDNAVLPISEMHKWIILKLQISAWQLDQNVMHKDLINHAAYMLSASNPKLAWALTSTTDHQSHWTALGKLKLNKTANLPPASLIFDVKNLGYFQLLAISRRWALAVNFHPAAGKNLRAVSQIIKCH